MATESKPDEATCAASAASAGSAGLLAAWAERCGLDVDDERVVHGWPRDFGLFRDGWQAAMESDEVRRLRLDASYANFD